MRFRAVSVLIALGLVLGQAAPALAADDDVRIEGAGWGHGVGLSQWGAYGLAVDNPPKTYTEILSHYYTGASNPVATTWTDSLWISLRRELSTAGLQLRQLMQGTPSAGATVTRGGEVHPLDDNGTVTIDVFGGTAGNPTCTYEMPGFNSPEGSCSIDIGWDGWAPAPTGKVCVTDSGKCYARGEIHIRPDNDTARFNVSVELWLDDYIEGISEMPYSWPIEALKAQAVAARSYAVFTADDRTNGGTDPLPTKCWCHLYDSANSDQHYLGWVDAKYNWDDAVIATTGEVLHYGGAVIKANYTSSNGGGSERNNLVWNEAALPYLQTVADPWSLIPQNPYASWEKVISRSAFEAAVGMASIDDVQIQSTYASGTPSDIAVIGTVGGVPTTKHFTGFQFDSMFGLRSAHVNAVNSLWNAVEIDRWFGANRYATAAAIAQQTHPGGADTVVIATGENFPDALAATPLAHVEGAPLLLVEKGSVPPVTAAELSRLDPDTILVMGGASAVSDGVVSALSAVASVTRISGRDRYATAAEISQRAFAGGAPIAYLATGTGFADAESGGVAAALEGGPMLLTPPGVLSEHTRAELARLQPETLVVLGGLSDAVITEAGVHATNVVSIMGSSRYSTAAEVSRRVFGAGSTTVFIAVGTNFPDALAAGQAAAGTPGPILLVPGSGALPGSVAAEIVRLEPERVVILGGTAAVSSAVEAQIDDLLN